MAQVNSVYTESRRRYSLKVIFATWSISGLASMLAEPGLSESVGSSLSDLLMLSAAAAASAIAIAAAMQKRYFLVFDMSSGSTAVFDSNNEEDVEALKQKIVSAMAK